jgi:hypothetical protein
MARMTAVLTPPFYMQGVPRSDCPPSAATLVGCSDDVISFGWCRRHALILSFTPPRFGASNSRITILYTLFQSDILKCIFLSCENYQIQK